MWFGVLITVNLSIGLITPPVGINLYVAANVTGLSIERVAKGALPFMLVCLIGLLIISAFPALLMMLVEILN